MIKLYDMPSSGNSYKVRLLFRKLGIDCERINAEYGSGVTQADWFLAKNPNGRVPMVEFDDGRLLTESNAILCHFGAGSRFEPDDPFDRAVMLSWLFWEQNSHESTVAVRAAILKYDHRAAERTLDVLNGMLQAGNRALSVMEARLSKGPFLVGDRITLADLSLYGYTHTAEERGGFDLSIFPGIRAWLDRVAADEPHIRLED